MPGHPELSVVIPTYNDAHCLELTLRSLTRQTLPVERFEVVVVRDGAGDGYEAIDGFQKDLDLRVVTLPTRRGRSSARNAGLAQARGRIIAFLDSDSYADPELLQRHVAFHNGGSLGRVLLGKRYEIDWPHVGYIVRDEPLPADLLSPAGYGDLRFSAEAGETADTWRATPWLFAHTNNVSAPAAALAAVGGFNEDFGTRWGWEDLELFYRVYEHLGRSAESFSYDDKAACFHLPRYRDANTFFAELLANLPLVQRLHPNLDWEFQGFGTPDMVAARIRRFRGVIGDCRDAGACRLAPVWDWATKRLAGKPGRRTLWIGFGTAEVPIGAEDLTFDHAAPASDRNFHLIGTAMPFPDNTVDTVVCVDLWRCLQWAELCGFLQEVTRVAGAALLVHTGADVPHQLPSTDAELAYLRRALASRFTMTPEDGDRGVTGIWVRQRPPAA